MFQSTPKRSLCFNLKREKNATNEKSSCLSLNVLSLQQTALHWSAFYNRPEHVRLLIKHDSNIGIPDSEGKIPLHWAANNQEPSATQTVRCILVRAVRHT